MKVLMIGTPTCAKCKRIHPKLEEYCKEHEIEFDYMHLNTAPKEILDIIFSKNVRQAPAFIIYRESETLVLSGESIFIELESL